MPPPLNLPYATKYRNFVSEPMGQKPATELAGIGEEEGERLANLGLAKANKVLAKYLLLDQDEERFRKWIRSAAAASEEQAAQCHRCLADWCQEFL